MSTQNATDAPKSARKRNERPQLTPSMALEILQTSLNYVQGSGLAVKIGNRNGLCVIGIAGAEWNHDTRTLCVTLPADTPAHGTADADTPDPARQ